MRKCIIIIVLIVSIIINPIIINARDRDRTNSPHSVDKANTDSSKLVYACLHQSAAIIIESILAVIPISIAMCIPGALSDNTLTTHQACLIFFTMGIYFLSVPVILLIYGRMTAEKIHNIIKYKRAIDKKIRKSEGN